jgi:hypothetical protein
VFQVTGHAWNVDEIIFKTIVMNHFYLKPLIAFAWIIELLLESSFKVRKLKPWTEFLVPETCELAIG